MSASDRVDILDEAKGYVTKDRNSSYGEPEDNFGAIAVVWNAQGVRIDGREVTPTDVALMMLGMKLARLRHNPTHRDSWADTIGYAACGWDTAKAALAREAVEAHKPNLSVVVNDDPGWISDKRCGLLSPHPAHQYSAGSRGFDELHGKPWCDGYVSPDRIAQQRDIDAVKAVADKGKGEGTPKRMANEPGA